jgi:alpha-glucosidase
MQPSIAILLLAAFISQSIASTFELSSPDGQIRFQLHADEQGTLLYSVAHGQHTRLEPARAGIIIDKADFGTDVSLGEPRIRDISEVFAWRGNKSQATNVCRAAEIPIRSKAGQWIFEARAFDDGVGFRYRVPGTGARRVQGEPTVFQIPKESTVWFQTDTRNYEGLYKSTAADKVPLEEEVQKKMQPVHLGPPMTIAFPDGGFGLLSEAALYNYSGMTLRPEGDAKFKAAFQDDPDGWPNDGEILSPWRVIVLSRDLNGIVNSDIIHSLCEPPDPKLFPAGMNTDWIRPGKAPCTWMVFGNDGAQWHRQKWFVDMTAAMGSEYLLVDAGWRTERWGWLKEGGDVWGRAAELCRYGAERNVGIILWHSFPEGRDDGPGLTSIDAREEFFRNCQQAGVKGVKIDFFDSESKAMIEAYEDLLRRAAKYQLMVNFHGANKPAGEPRTWPNEVTREGIREQEYLLWSTIPLPHYGALPFTRMAAGHADFLPGYVQSRFLRNTSLAFQMASVVVFSSPFLCWPDNPEAYLNSPVLQFVRSVPVAWDETRVLPQSSIGETVILARRKGSDWYVAVLNCKAEPRTLEIDLSFVELAGKELTVYRDGPDLPACQIESGIQPPTNGKLPVSLLPGGGFVGHVSPPKKFDGWR